MQNYLENKNILIGIGVIVLLFIIGGVWWLVSGNGGSSTSLGDGRGVEGEPVDVVLDFYEPWLSAVRATNTDPFILNLHNSAEASVALSEKLQQVHQESPDAEMDPVLCQATPPTGLRARPLYQEENEAQILVTAAEKGFPGQATVTLQGEKGKWSITDISCTNGESAPEGEFSFDQEGVLLKEVPPPLDSQYWHIVFEQNGVFGHAAPLFFTAESSCKNADDADISCDGSQFNETSKVLVQGEMSEVGVNVKNLKLLQ